MSILCGLLLLLDAPHVMMAEPAPAAVAAFNAYSRGVESRLAQQHRAPSGFLVPAATDARLQTGEVVIKKLTPPTNAHTGDDFPGALLHHWRGTAFAPGATAAGFERLMRDFNAYPKRFAPQVLQARVLHENGDKLEAWMRVRQKHVITVELETTYDVTFGRLDVRHGYSISESTNVAELDAPGTSKERALTGSEEHGFLWRLNTYWSYEERDGGLYLQIEAVSLTRAIPTGLGWAIRPYVESIPRESMEFTLRSACAALKR